MKTQSRQISQIMLGLILSSTVLFVAACGRAEPEPEPLSEATATLEAVDFAEGAQTPPTNTPMPPTPTTAPEPAEEPAAEPVSPVAGMSSTTSSPLAESQTAPAVLEKQGGKLSERLQQLIFAVQNNQGLEVQAEAMSLPLEGPGSLMRNEAGDPLVEIRVTDTGEASLNTLGNYDVTVTNVADDFNIVTAYVPALQLRDVAELDIVENISEALQPQ